ncbi:hypothetical protein BDN72DRAFT_957677 [Pluteus cervinus]|uniref:Uncharacterized protein n=1 Tax=Pluteus cervinus TaxID=181527 RepID=A0ACD3B1P2_9AGAR|nr:hypothetical protein BDN72DRAFT_957677 [Pluteus cervinus]
MFGFEDPDEFSNRLDRIFRYNPPFPDTLDRHEGPENLGSFPFNFYDRHLDENLRLKRVVLLPELATDLGKQVDDHMEDLRKRSVDHLPLTDETKRDFRYDPPDRVASMQIPPWNLAAMYEKIERNLVPLASHWLISPDFSEYESTLIFSGRQAGYRQSRDEPVVHYSLRFCDYSSHSPELLSQLDDLTRGMLETLQHKNLGTWIFLPVLSQIESAFKDMDRVAKASTIPASSCTTGGAWIPKPTPGNDKPLVDALNPPLTLPRVVAKNGKTKSPSSSKDIRPDNRTDQRLPDFAKSGKVSPEGILHYAWRRAVDEDSTVIIMNCGSYERIGIRHRATQTLYLSGLIEVWKSTPSYGKLHLGLHMVIIRDAIDRYKQQVDQDLKKKPEKKRRNAVAESPQPDRRSSRIAYQALKSDVARTHGRNRKAKLDIWKAIDRPCALMSLRYPPLNSPTPAACLKIGQSLAPHVLEATPYEWKTQFDTADCFTITLHSIFASGTNGHIHAGTLEVVADGQTLRHDVLIKVATHSQPRKRLVREFSMYKRLWTHKVTGVPAIYGLFEDYDNLATLLVMERAGVSLRHRQTGTIEDPIVVGVIPGEIAKCVSIVEQIHEAGILHRDLRVDNIVFAPDGSPRIIDFDRAILCTSEQDKEQEIKFLKTYLSGKDIFHEWPGIGDLLD